MRKILAATAVLGLLGLPILASAQSANQPATKKETAANPATSTKKAAKANATKQAAKKGSMKRHAQVTKRRPAMHGPNMRHATAKHGKRFAKAHGRHRHASGFSTAKTRHQASVKSRTTNAGRAATEGRTSIQRKAAYQAAPTQRNCGEFMYWKNGKCNDARNKSAK